MNILIIVFNIFIIVTFIKIITASALITTIGDNVWYLIFANKYRVFIFAVKKKKTHAAVNASNLFANGNVQIRDMKKICLLISPPFHRYLTTIRFCIINSRMKLCKKPLLLPSKIRMHKETKLYQTSSSSRRLRMADSRLHCYFQGFEKLFNLEISSVGVTRLLRSDNFAPRRDIVRRRNVCSTDIGFPLRVSDIYSRILLVSWFCTRINRWM